MNSKITTPAAPATNTPPYPQKFTLFTLLNIHFCPTVPSSPDGLASNPNPTSPPRRFPTSRLSPPARSFSSPGHPALANLRSCANSAANPKSQFFNCPAFRALPRLSSISSPISPSSPRSPSYPASAWPRHTAIYCRRGISRPGSSGASSSRWRSLVTIHVLNVS